MTTTAFDDENAERLQVIELEKQLRAKGREKKDVRSLRAKFAEACAGIILSDPDFAEKRETWTALWYFVFYCVIEEFRAKIRAAAAAAAAGKAVNIRKIVTDFRDFIAEATKFYDALIAQIKKKYGIVENGEPGAMAVVDSKSLIYARRSCYKIFTYLGDLARYKEQYPDRENYTPDWKIPATYYFKAVKIWPSTGHPHNQLAVLAIYSHNDFLALYHYFRSLTLDEPFLTARDNLVLLFERNRQKYGELVEQQVQKKNAEESEVLKSFFIRFVRLNGIIFTRTSLETFAEVNLEAVRDLETLLSLDLSILTSLFTTELRKPGEVSGLTLAALQVVSILICSVPTGSSRSSYADVLQHSTISKHALAAAFKIIGCFISFCSKANDIAGSPLLPACLVFFEWLAYKQEWPIGSVDDKQVTAQALFWKESLVLLNAVCEIESWDGTADDVTATALWEDYELRGFTPLLTAQLRLVFNNRVTEEAHSRLRRILSAGKSIAELVDCSDSGAGLAFDKMTSKFFLAGNHKERKSREKVAISKEQRNAVTTEFSVQGPSSASSSSLPATDDEEEEVIVFQPAAKVPPTVRDDFTAQAAVLAPVRQNFTAAHAKATTPVQELVTGPVRGEFTTALVPVGGPVREQFTAAQAPPIREEFTAAPAEPVRDVREVTAALTPVAGPEFTATLARPVREEFTTALPPIAGPVREDFTSTLAPVAGASRELFTSALGPVAIPIREEFTASATPISASVRSDFTVQDAAQVRDGFKVHIRDNLALARDEYGQFPAPAQQNDISAPIMRAKVSSLGPPPGFGPIPQRATSKWTDSYRAPAPQSLFSTNFGIWSNSVPVPKTTPYPFPGMEIRPLQQIEQEQQQQPFHPSQPLYGSWKTSDSSAIELQLQQLNLQLQQQLQQQQQPPPPPPPAFGHDPFIL